MMPRRRSSALAGPTHMGHALRSATKFSFECALHEEFPCQHAPQGEVQVSPGAHGTLPLLARGDLSVLVPARKKRLDFWELILDVGDFQRLIQRLFLLLHGLDWVDLFLKHSCVLRAFACRISSRRRGHSARSACSCSRPWRRPNR